MKKYSPAIINMRTFIAKCCKSAFRVVLRTFVVNIWYFSVVDIYQNPSHLKWPPWFRFEDLRNHSDSLFNFFSIKISTCEIIWSLHCSSNSSQKSFQNWFCSNQKSKRIQVKETPRSKRKSTVVTSRRGASSMLVVALLPVMEEVGD